MTAFIVHENTCLNGENSYKNPTPHKKTQTHNLPRLIMVLNCFLWPIHVISAELNSTQLNCLCWPHTEEVMCHAVIYYSLVTVKLCLVCLLLAKVPQSPIISP